MENPSPPDRRELESLHHVASVGIRKHLLMNAPEAVLFRELDEARGVAWEGFIAVRVSQKHIPRLRDLKQRVLLSLVVHRISRHAQRDPAPLEQADRIQESPRSE